MATFFAGGMTLQGGLVHDGWKFSEVVDWYAVTASKADVVERESAHGAFGIGPDYRESAVISVSGEYFGSSPADVLRAVEALKVAFARNQPLTVTFDDDFRPTSRVVSVRGIQVPDLHGETYFSFVIDMVAPDFRRYGAEVVTTTGLPTSGGGLDYPIKYPVEYGVPGDSGRLTVTNLGTENTFPVLEVSGGMSGGFELTDVRTGRVLQYVRAVPLGATVVIDLRTKQVYQDDVANNVSRWLTRREWWSQPAGVTSEIQFNSLGTVTGVPILSARVASAY